MKENATASALRTLGGCIIGVGTLGAFGAGLVFPAVTVSRSGAMNSSYNWGLVAMVIAGSIVSGALFFGIAEIISLLQQIANKMRLGDPKTDTLNDIELNLPNI